MSSDDCKKFIESISATHSLTGKWKRTRKYKDSDIILRDFVNNTGDQITISEDKFSNLGLYSINIKALPLSQNSLSYLTKKILLDALSDLSEKHLEEKNDFYNEMKNSEISCSHKFIYKMYYMGETFVNDALSVNVEFDDENSSIYYCERDSISYLRLECGGDWEQPIIAFAYWSQNDKRIKGFFPRGDGNVYNQETNKAYGNEDDDDFKIPVIDYDRAESIGFEQLKKIIAKDYANNVITPKISIKIKH